MSLRAASCKHLRAMRAAPTPYRYKPPELQALAAALGSGAGGGPQLVSNKVGCSLEDTIPVHSTEPNSSQHSNCAQAPPWSQIHVPPPGNQ